MRDEENIIESIRVNWANGDIDFFFEGSEEPFVPQEFTGETNEKMNKIADMFYATWYDAKKKIDGRRKGR